MKHRELLHCTTCGSCARFRGIIHAIHRELLSNRLGSILRSAAERKDITGIGLSDSDVYSSELERIFSYTNTYYHKSPMLDIMSSASVAKYEPVDFVVCSDVLEHVQPPAITAFCNLRKLVRPNGVLILTVPYLEGYETIEHYPHLFKFKTINLGDGSHAIVNKRRGGLIECFPQPEFHGGEGELLEMRLFGEGDLCARLAYAGFSSVEPIEAILSEIGYTWDYNVERPEFNDRRAKSCAMVCR